jgi:predicted nucleic acid-binding protein
VKLYLDSTALVKLVQVESESEALRDFLRRHATHGLVTSALSQVEVARAVIFGGRDSTTHAQRLLSRLDHVALTGKLLEEAAGFSPKIVVRSFDAIHLAAARVVGSELRAFLTYNYVTQLAAFELGMRVERPA